MVKKRCWKRGTPEEAEKKNLTFAIPIQLQTSLLCCTFIPGTSLWSHLNSWMFYAHTENAGYLYL